MLCLSNRQKGPRTRARKAVASSSRGSGSTTPTAQLACAALPAPEEPERFPHPPSPGMQAAAGIKVFHSPRIGCQLSDQHPFSSSSWTALVHGLLRRGNISEGGSGDEGLQVVARGQGKSLCALTELIPVSLWLWLILQSLFPKTGEMFREKQPGCVGEQI